MTTGQGVQLYEGNCLDLLPEIPDGCVQAVITDPPYMSAMQHNGSMTDFSDCENLRPFYRMLIKGLISKLASTGSVYWCCDWRSYPKWGSCL